MLMREAQRTTSRSLATPKSTMRVADVGTVRTMSIAGKVSQIAREMEFYRLPDLIDVVLAYTEYWCEMHVRYWRWRLEVTCVAPWRLLQTQITRHGGSGKFSIPFKLKKNQENRKYGGASYQRIRNSDRTNTSSWRSERSRSPWTAQPHGLTDTHGKLPRSTTWKTQLQIQRLAALDQVFRTISKSDWTRPKRRWNWAK